MERHTERISVKVAAASLILIHIGLAVGSLVQKSQVVGERPDLFPLGRLTTVLLSAILAYGVFRWSWRLFGNRGSLLTLTLYAFSPTVLAHGRLMTLDLPVAGALLGTAALGRWWWRRGPGKRWAVMAVIAAAGCLAGLLYLRQGGDVQTLWFMNGKLSQTRPGFFYLYCFLVKTPLPLFVLWAMAGWVWWSSKHSVRTAWNATAALWWGVIGYLLLIHLIDGSLGHRALLPVYPLLFILAGAAAHLRKAGLGVLLIVMGLFVGQSLRAWPAPLTFFNRAAGGPHSGYQHLVGDNLDWGQDLPALKQWLDRHAYKKTPQQYLAYFGKEDPGTYGLLMPTLLFGSSVLKPLDVLEFSGGTYFISATVLQGAIGSGRGVWTTDLEKQLASETQPRRLNELRMARLCAHLRHRPPDELIGNSLLVYYLSDEQVKYALTGRLPSDGRGD